MSSLPQSILKRDCSVVPFDANKISQAISKGFQSCKIAENNQEIVNNLTRKVCDKLMLKSEVTVENCQDTVEKVLCEEGYYEVFRSYLLYREKHAEKRKEFKNRDVSSDLKKIFQKGRSYFTSDFSYAVYLRTYARWSNKLQRREHWPETVTRYMDFMKENIRDRFTSAEYEELHNAILNMDVMPSMRLLQFAGDAARRNNLCAYNCSYVAPCKIEDFRSIFMLLLSGCGVGFSIEKKYVDQLPIISSQKKEIPPMNLSIGDSREAWCDALKMGMDLWYNGYDIIFDYSQLRPCGAKLITTGGTSSGPEPLRKLLNFSRNTILDNAGRKLTTLQVYDLICMIGDIVKVGGVRRAALISLSDLNDNDMRDAKTGNFFLTWGHS